MDSKTGKEKVFEEARRRLIAGGGKQYWRSIGEVLETPEAQKWLDDEFPERRSIPEMDRRELLKYMGAATLMASLAGCRSLPQAKIVPYVKQPEEHVPGKALYYATSFTLGGYATGVLAQSRQGRPIKLEGNPDHPSSLGSTGIFEQAAIYGLYDPERAQTVTTGRMPSTIAEFTKNVLAILDQKKGTGGAGVAILTEGVTSPSLGAQIDRFLAKYPGAKWHFYEPVHRDSVRAGSAMAFGRPLEPVYDFAKADVVLSLDSNFLNSGPGNVRYARDFATRRGIEGVDASNLNRLYAVESAPSVTGANADHRLAMKASAVADFARALASMLGLPVRVGEPGPASWMKGLFSDLNAARGRSIVIAGEHQPPVVHALAHAINNALGNIGQTVRFIKPPEHRSGSHTASIRELAANLRAGKVDALLVLGGNPAYSAPAELEFASLIPKAKFAAHLSPFHDETSALCSWHVPESHFLESWGDARAFDGTVSMIQPLIDPLYSTVTASELLEQLTRGVRGGREIVFERWLGGQPPKEAEEHFEVYLHDGLIRGSAYPAEAATLDAASLSTASSPALSGLEAVFLPDPTVYDGRFNSNAWLQELHKPMTSLTWDNSVQLSPKTAESLGVKEEDVVEVTLKGRKVEGAAWIVPGQANDVVVMHLGYGRTAGAPNAYVPPLMGTSPDVESVRGFNAFTLRTSDEPFIAGGVEIRKTGRSVGLADTQQHHRMNTPDLVRSGTVAELAENPAFAEYPNLEKEELPSLYSEGEFAYDGHKWAMTIDLNLCIGCGACTMACNVENNVPAVGKIQVEKGREMHWIRVDRYYRGSLDDPEVIHQPLPCMHCENAPCEPVCPVAATTHSKEGLNQMVYNRCVGTRYCSNNCPYKVRRFNYLNYADKVDHPQLTLLNNPDVTVRGRGVMEKCTYCVQRINAARIDSKKSGKPIEDGAIVTACQQACPTKAIVFGDLSDAKSAAARLRKDPRNWTLLRELNTRPRTTYLSRVRNPNKEVETS